MELSGHMSIETALLAGGASLILGFLILEIVTSIARARRAARLLNPCPECKGYGIIYPDLTPGDYGFFFECPKCEGYGEAR